MPTVHWPGPIVLPPDFDDAGAPDPLLCPITQCLMTEPALVVSSGRTYERAAIVRWISEHGTDPLDRETSLNIASLAPNLAVRQMVETWARERNGGVLPNQDVRGSSEVVVDADNINDDSQENTAVLNAGDTAVRTNASLATRPFAGEDDPIVDGTVTVLGHYRFPGAPPSEDGKFFLFSSARLAKVLRGRPWSHHGSLEDAGTNVKGGAGATLIVRNQRTNKESGCMFFGAGGGANGVGVGCWNPAEYSEPGSFRRGDVLVLVHFVGNDVPALTLPAGMPLEVAEITMRVLKPTRVTKHTGTGWNLEGSEIAFGRCGIVGDWWKELVVEFDFGEEEVTVTGVRTDSGEDLPVKVEVWRPRPGRTIDDVNCRWDEANFGLPERNYDPALSSGIRGGQRTVPVFNNVRKVRCTWAETDLHKTHGLSTARCGGGIHCEVIGVPAGSMIMLPDGTMPGLDAAPADGSGGRQRGRRLPMV